MNTPWQDIILHKKRFNLGKFILYYIFIQIILIIVWGLIFLSSTLWSFNDTFKNKWNEAIIQQDNKYINDLIKKNNNIKYTNVNNCSKKWFYNKKDNLFFCYDHKKYTFIKEKKINNLIIQKKELLIKYLIFTFGFSLIFIISISIFNKSLFRKWIIVNNLSQSSQEFISLIKEIEEYIWTKDSKLEYRLPTLEAIWLWIIEEEPDFFNRFWNVLKKLSKRAEDNFLKEVSNKLDILYREIEKIYFFKKKKYFKYIGSELSLILSKYNTSIISYIVNILFFIILSSGILYLLQSLNGENIKFINSLNDIINIFSFRNANIQNNVYYFPYILSLEFISYLILFITINLIFKIKK